MLRQAIITSKTANAIAVANTVIIVANERTYITPYSNVRNTLFPWTENCPSHPEPNSSRWATPPSLIQQRPGQSPQRHAAGEMQGEYEQRAKPWMRPLGERP